MKSLIFILLCSFLVANNLRSQDSTTIRFFVKGGEAYRIRIDGELMPPTNVLKLHQGSHRVEIWSFKKQTYSSQFNTGKLDSTNYYAELKPATEYLSYLMQRDDYKRKLFLFKTAPILVAGVSILALPFTFYGMKEKHEQLVQDQFLNQHRQTTQALLKNTTRQHNTRVALFGTALGGSLLGLAGVFILGPKAKELTEPIFRQQNPFTLEYIDLSYNNQTQQPELSLMLNF